MGIIWRVAMPLLSTLAALVIIVHSEEDLLDRDRRYDLRPRLLDTGTPGYDQPWRAIEEESVVNRSPSTDIWDDSPEDLPKRRRQVRKRKRRPLSAEDRPLAERKTFPVDPRNNDPYPSHIDTSQATDLPRKRRKKPELRRNRWADEFDPERPMRRRGQRRKRPSLDTFPVLSEFNEYRTDEFQPARTEENDPLRIEETSQPTDNDHFSETLFLADPELPPNNYFHDEEESSFFDTSTGTTDENKMSAKEDKSLSEFSMELLVHNKDDHEPDLNVLSAKMNEKSHILKDKEGYVLSNLTFGRPAKKTHYLRDKIPSLNDAIIVYNSLEDVKVQEKLKKMHDQYYSPFHRPLKTIHKIKHKIRSLNDDLVKRSDNLMKEFYADKGFIDPFTLKEILKRSNGTSLSEILQQHNLSLSDLLSGREDAISVLKTKDSKETVSEDDTPISTDDTESNLKKKQNNEDKIISESKIEPVLASFDETSNQIRNETNTVEPTEPNPQETMEPKENSPKIAPSRRYPGTLRRRLRVKPVVNNTFKANVNRDIIALTARKYLQHARNLTKSKEWKIMINSSTPSYEDDKKDATESPITTTISEETTTVDDSEYSNPSTIPIDIITEDKDTQEEIDLSDITTTALTTEAPTTTIIVTTTEKVKPNRSSRPNQNRTGIRRQPINRLKRRRMKQKTSTTSPFEQEDGNHNFALSSELVTKTQTPLNPNSDDDFTTLEDFMTTERAKKTENGVRNKNQATSPKPSTTAVSTTEETAKFEIEEILNDTRTSARLSRILMERNMTLNELVEHRERGSSHVHLADIFHNASKEPNPPEPFLSKSSIEPISKETYPLRALLEANLHDPPLKATTIDPNQNHGVNIPVAMDFGNNVNENSENMGIVSLFNKFAEKEAKIAKSLLNSDSEGVPYVTTIESANTTADDNLSDNVRKSKSMGDNNLQQDIMNWNDLFALMRKKSKNDTEENEISFAADSSDKKSALDQDRDGDGLIVLEDLHNFKDLDSHIASASNEKLEVNTYERVDVPPRDTGFHNNTKSVTVATASIVGLAMILFLLTYAVFKWRTQRRMLNKKKSFNEENIPTPVFESRKGHKSNCSTRSISPMLATSNIYTLNTLESRNGKESPEYMWDSLRKPFQ